MVGVNLSGISQEIMDLKLEIEKTTQQLKHLKEKITILFELQGETYLVTPDEGKISLRDFGSPYLPNLSQEFKDLSLDEKVDLVISTNLLIPDFKLDQKAYSESKDEESAQQLKDYVRKRNKTKAIYVTLANKYYEELERKQEELDAELSKFREENFSEETTDEEN